MQIPVLIEPVADSGYRARGVGSFGFTVEAATPEEVIQKLQEQIKGHLAAGARIVPLEVPPTEHPWAEFAGWLRGNPMLDAWKQAMAEYRRQRDEELDMS
jgi:predicted RNase H-like HicB family nuclease